MDQPTAAQPTIRRARPEERDSIARLLGEAFMDDPVSGWVFPDETHRRTAHPRFFGVMLDAALRDGWVDVSEDVSAAALWLPIPAEEAHGSGSTADSPHAGAPGAPGALGGSDGDGATDGAEDDGDGDGGDEPAMAELLAAADPGNERVVTVARLTGEAHPTGTAHYYLPAIVAAPGRQSAGLGGALLASALDRCDRERTPAYLEASNTRSKALYERLGFVLCGRTVDLPGGPSLWPMWREPRA
ncbi:GNAT family N-acetyltransferase [Streptomyces sp. NPDC002055]|uniref:GNAT family N-acetyltransferase n=1 Tax=Streptomyces sp. NPDC002055 TaxID=3154534 RepID=UPI0033330D2F